MAKYVLTADNLDDFSKEFAKRLHLGDIVLLSGPMGAGKTAFTKSLIPHITGQDDEVQSPTFPICLTYEGKKNVIHYDLYRLTSPVDLDEYGWSDMRDDNITIVEWPERADQSFLSAPGHHIHIGFGVIDHERIINMEVLT